MTSVLTSTRQVPLATTFYQVPSSGVTYYELLPAIADGSYPGVMQQAGVTPGVTNVIARDMGKTVTYNGSFYRQVQFLVPNPVASPDQAGIVGGGTTKYGTYYIVVPIAGFSSALALAGLVPLAGGQM